MKFAFNSASTPKLTLPEMLETARKYGYQGLEIRSGVGHLHGIELEAGPVLRRSFRQQAAEAGIELVCLGISHRYSRPQEAEAQLVGTMAYIRLAHDLGIQLLRVFCGRIPENDTREQAKRSIVAALRRLGSYAGEHGVTLVVETHDDWSDPAYMAEIMQETAHSHIAATWDVLHTQLEGNAAPEAVLSSLGPWIRHVHIHDGVRKQGSDRHHPHYRPIGSGEIDHLGIIRLLLSHGYEGYLSGEWFDWEPHDIHLPREIKSLRQYVELARKGNGNGF
ncbi:sugar phosphate isomerase/epimerase family protein [Paenibacillus sp. SI8]|uniref:sugar phosphate isomerase/epimerase family protein n=1 Tax=unclassified Paenibacillus TaxID=185978 RepID=UPI003466EE19